MPRKRPAHLIEEEVAWEYEKIYQGFVQSLGITNGFAGEV
jgi:hypothetical protein